MAYKNKEDQKIASQRHYRSNREIMIARAKKFTIFARKRNAQFIREYKLQRGCSKCDERDPRCLDFHHIGPKSHNVADAVNQAWSIERLLKEIEKCVLLCSNCHRKITA